jgi:hypothetical protein
LGKNLIGIPRSSDDGLERKGSERVKRGSVGSCAVLLEGVGVVAVVKASFSLEMQVLMIREAKRDERCFLRMLLSRSGQFRNNGGSLSSTLKSSIERS